MSLYAVRVCSDCKREIESHEELYETDRTAEIVCVECADQHLDVTLVRSEKNH